MAALHAAIVFAVRARCIVDHWLGPARSLTEYNARMESPSALLECDTVDIFRSKGASNIPRLDDGRKESAECRERKGGIMKLLLGGNGTLNGGCDCTSSKNVDR